MQYLGPCPRTTGSKDQGPQDHRTKGPDCLGLGSGRLGFRIAAHVAFFHVCQVFDAYELVGELYLLPMCDLQMHDDPTMRTTFVSRIGVACCQRSTTGFILSGNWEESALVLMI